MVASARIWSQVQVVGVSTNPSTVNVHDAVSSLGVASAVSTGQEWPVSYWPGGSRGSLWACPLPEKPLVKPAMRASPRGLISTFWSRVRTRQTRSNEIAAGLSQVGPLGRSTSRFFSPGPDAVVGAKASAVSLQAEQAEQPAGTVDHRQPASPFC